MRKYHCLVLDRVLERPVGSPELVVGEPRWRCRKCLKNYRRLKLAERHVERVHGGIRG